MWLRSFPGVLSLEQCERTIALYRDQLAPSLVGHTEETRAPSPARTSYSAKLAALPEDVRAELEPRLATLTALPSSHLERWELIRYRPGERFLAHFDLRQEPNARRFTALVCLRAPLAGGATVFPFLRLELPPRPGLLLVWANTTRDGLRLPSSLHAGAPIVQGEKWCLATWVHAAPWGR